MPNIISTFIASRFVKKALIRDIFFTRRLTTQSNFSRNIHITNSEFSDNENNIQGVYHHSVRATNTDNDPFLIVTNINNLIKSHPNSLFFLTQKSRILKRDELNLNRYSPLESDELNNITLMIKLINNQWLRPDGGHTCMAITNTNGAIIKNTDVSLRPDQAKKAIISGKTVLHRNLYKEGPALVKPAKHTYVSDEINQFAKDMIKDKSIAAELTFIPISLSKLSITQIIDNIKSAQAIELYNICSSIVKTEDIDKIDDHKIRQYVKELKERASGYKSLQQIIKPESESILAALACTNAIVKACCGSLDEFNSLKADQDTQTIVVYCVMALIGTKKFLDFATKINFYDNTSTFTKK